MVNNYNASKELVQRECAIRVFDYMYEGKWPYKIKPSGAGGVTPAQVKEFKLQAMKNLGVTPAEMEN